MSLKRDELQGLRSLLVELAESIYDLQNARVYSAAAQRERNALLAAQRRNFRSAAVRCHQLREELEAVWF